MKSYLTGGLLGLRDVRAAIAASEGLPRRGTVVGGPDYLPRVYTPGAPGWTAHVCPDVVDAGDGTGALEIPPEAVKHLGKRVTVSGKSVDIPAANTVVTALPAKFDGVVSKSEVMT